MIKCQLLRGINGGSNYTSPTYTFCQHCAYYSSRPTSRHDSLQLNPCALLCQFIQAVYHGEIAKFCHDRQSISYQLK